MNRLDLNAYGVSEMNDAEMRETDGGIFPVVILGVVITKKAAAWICAGAAVGGLFAAGTCVGYRQAAAGAN
jgi:lactobin A/cerein 7B family class IIb bacteriocin